MSTALLLVTHDGIGQALLEVATQILGSNPMQTEVIAVPAAEAPDLTRDRISIALERLDQGDGVLILTDIYGATPGNAALQAGMAHHTRVVAGMNLPMLLRVLNYAGQPLDALADTALTGARAGLIAPSREPT